MWKEITASHWSNIWAGRGVTSPPLADTFLLIKIWSPRSNVCSFLRSGASLSSFTSGTASGNSRKVWPLSWHQKLGVSGTGRGSQNGTTCSQVFTSTFISHGYFLWRHSAPQLPERKWRHVSSEGIITWRTVMLCTVIYFLTSFIK